MKSVNSISGGQTSSYIAANYPADYNLFSIVCIDDPNLSPKDPKQVQWINDKLEKSGFLDVYGEFIATVEFDDTIYTMMDLEQKFGLDIDVVRGLSFDEVLKTKGGWLPNKIHRYCTTWMKIVPISEFIYYNIGETVEMRIGYRANELKRVAKMKDKLNENGKLDIKIHTSTNIKSKRRKNLVFEHQVPVFPLVSERIMKDQIVEWWKGKDVRFSKMNNCVGCFHRNPVLLRKMVEEAPGKMNWFASKEGGKNGHWRSDASSANIIKHKLQNVLSFDDFDDCDSGYCGL